MMVGVKVRRRIGRSALAWLLVAMAAGALAGPAGAADTALTTDPTADAVAAFGGWTVWSRQDVDGRYRLVVAAPGGQPGDANLPASTQPVDAQLSPSPDGSDIVATFTLCSPGCAAQQYLLMTGASSALRLGGRRCRASGVSSWMDAVAYVARGSGCHPAGVWYRRARGRPRLIAKSSNATTTDLNGTQLLWAGEFYLRVQGVRARRARTLFIFPPGEGESYEVRSPSLAGDGFAYYALRHLLAPDYGQVLLRQPVTDPNACQYLNRPPVTRVGETKLAPVSVAVDRGAVYYTNGADVYQATDPPPEW